MVKHGRHLLSGTTKYGSQTHPVDGKLMEGICINKKDGKIKYRLSLFSNETVEPLGNNVNSYGLPPVIEKDAVYIHFGSYGTTAIDTNSGKEIWKRTDLECRHFRGPDLHLLYFKIC